MHETAGGAGFERIGRDVQVAAQDAPSAIDFAREAAVRFATTEQPRTGSVRERLARSITDGEEVFTMRWILGTCAGLALLILASFVWEARPWAAPIGAACTRYSDCAGSRSWCSDGTPRRYCTRTCRADTDCPSTWHCGPSGYNSVMYMHGERMGPGTPVDICWQAGDGRVADGDRSGP